MALVPEERSKCTVTSRCTSVHVCVVDWLCLEPADRILRARAIIHKFKLQDLLSKSFITPNDVQLRCNGVDVNYAQDRADYVKLYSELINRLRRMTEE